LLPSGIVSVAAKGNCPGIVTSNSLLILFIALIRYLSYLTYIIH
jgi:hypothetical protein